MTFKVGDWVVRRGKRGLVKESFAWSSSRGNILWIDTIEIEERHARWPADECELCEEGDVSEKTMREIDENEGEVSLINTMITRMDVLWGERRELLRRKELAVALKQHQIDLRDHTIHTLTTDNTALKADNAALKEENVLAMEAFDRAKGRELALLCVDRELQAALCEVVRLEDENKGLGVEIETLIGQRDHFHARATSRLRHWTDELTKGYALEREIITLTEDNVAPKATIDMHVADLASLRAKNEALEGRFRGPGPLGYHDVHEFYKDDDDA